MATKTLRQVVTVPKARKEQSVSEKLRNCLYSASGMLGAYFGSHVSIEHSYLNARGLRAT